jgi:chromosome segregation ATPase
MLKKLLIAAVAVVVGLAVVHSTRLGSYFRLNWHKATAWAQKQVPLETEVERLREEVSRLGRDSKTHFNAIAEEMVGVEKLEADVGRSRAGLEKLERSIQTMRTDLKAGDEFITYGDTKYSRKQVESQLNRDWDTFKRAKSELKAKEEMLEARKGSLAKAREQLAAMQDVRRDMEVELTRLEAELKTVRLAQTRSKFHLDDSELSRVKEGIEALRTRINVERRALEVEGEFTTGRISVDKKLEKDVLKEIDAHFEKGEK